MLYYDIFTDEVITEPTPESVPIGVEEYLGPNSSFKDGVQFAWDATSISIFKTCPYKYYLSQVVGWNHKLIPPPLAFGIYMHRILQTWHVLRATGLPQPDVLLRCIKLAGLLGEKLPNGDNARGKEQLVRATMWYFEQFWDDRTKTVILSSGKPAVEYSFTLPFFTHLDLDVYLCGHIDRLVQWDGRILAADYKTTKYQTDQKWLNSFKPTTQFPLYIAATQIIAAETQELPATDGILLDGIQLGVNFNRYIRYVIPYTPEEINDYLKGLTYWVKQAMNACDSGYFPQNEESCSKYGSCQFREICSKPQARRESYLKGHFRKTTWDPLRNR